MNETVSKKISVIYDNVPYVIDLTMRSFYEYERKYNRGLGADIDNIFSGNSDDVIKFLSTTLRYPDKFYENTTENKIIKEKDFEKISKDKIRFLLKLSTWARLVIFEHIKDVEPNEESKSIKKKKKHKKKK